MIPIDTGGGGMGWGAPNMLHNTDTYNFQHPSGGGTWANANQYTYTLQSNYAKWSPNPSPPAEYGQHYHAVSISNQGSGSAHENWPPYYALCYIMKK